MVESRPTVRRRFIALGIAVSILYGISVLTYDDGHAAEGALDEVTGRLEAQARRQHVEVARVLKARAALAGIVIQRAEFFYDVEHRTVQKKIEFTISNGWTEALRMVSLRAILTTPDRTIPWVETTLECRLSGGLESGESKTLQFLVERWETPLDPTRAKLTLTVVGAVGAATTLDAIPRP